MEKLPARAGRSWIWQGFGLFRKQPLALAGLFLGYMLCMLAIGRIPYLGQIMPVVLVPIFSVTFMQACSQIERQQRVWPSLLVAGFRRPAFASLFRLGLLYLLVAVIAVGASALVDHGVFWDMVTGQIDPSAKEPQEAPQAGAILLALALYLPAAMGFCFGAPLIFWQKMPVGKAIFFSFFAVLRGARAFLMFALSWFMISVVASWLVLLVGGRSEAAMIVMVPLSVVLTVVMHCSFYAAYRQIFGVPGTAPASAPPEVL